MVKSHRTMPGYTIDILNNITLITDYCFPCSSYANPGCPVGLEKRQRVLQSLSWEVQSPRIGGVGITPQARTATESVVISHYLGLKPLLMPVVLNMGIQSLQGWEKWKGMLESYIAANLISAVSHGWCFKVHAAGAMEKEVLSRRAVTPGARASSWWDRTQCTISGSHCEFICSH